MIAFGHVVARNNFVFVIAMIDIFYLNRRPQKMIDVNATECYALAYGGLLSFYFYIVLITGWSMHVYLKYNGVYFMPC